MPELGDIVVYRYRGGSAKGRVTGIAPNGWPRVRLENGQYRVWRARAVTVVMHAKPIGPINISDGELDWEIASCGSHEHRQALLDIRLKRDLKKWLGRVGVERATAILTLVENAKTGRADLSCLNPQ